MEIAASPQVRSVAASRGWDWIVEGYNLVKKSPGAWIATFVVWIVLYAVASWLPLGSLLTSLLGSVIMGGWMIGCKSADSGGPIKVEHLFAAFSGGLATPLIMVSLVYLACFTAALLVAGLIGGISLLPLLIGKFDASAFNPSFLLAGLIVLALTLPLSMAVLFAPALVVFDRMPAVAAMKLSFHACLRNVMPFLIYGLVGFVLVIVASIPLGLGLLVLGPVMIASIYTSYQDIFVRA